jgi:hypothetical protein
MTHFFFNFIFKDKDDKDTLLTFKIWNSYGTSHTNSDPEWKNDFLCDFHHRTNLTALLLSSLGFRNKITHSKF